MSINHISPWLGGNENEDSNSSNNEIGNSNGPNNGGQQLSLGNKVIFLSAFLQSFEI